MDGWMSEWGGCCFLWAGWKCGKTKVEVMDKLWWQESTKWNPWMMDAETKVPDLEEQKP